MLKRSRRTLNAPDARDVASSVQQQLLQLMMMMMVVMMMMTMTLFASCQTISALQMCKCRSTANGCTPHNNV
jgi:hypothetical protein